MPPSVDSPVQTRIPIPIPDGVLGSGKSGGIQTRPVGRRRIFVQTDTGSVLGIELDRADSAQTVKKKMQAMLNVPTEQTALVFGDTVIKGDLSEVRNDSPLLLTRELQRSLSTPCIYPIPDLQVLMDLRGQPFEVVGGVRCCPKMKRILKEVNKAINCGVEPVAVSGGLGGAYYFRNTSGDSVAIVKPTDEEPFAPNNPKGYIGRSLGQPGLKKAVRVGETGVREVAAYLLDHENFAKVPPTVLVKVAHHAFNVNGASTVQKGEDKVSRPVAKIASCQKFVHHDYDASDHGTSRFSVSAVHRIGILDVRIFNTDRHAGNILIRNMKSFDRTWSCSNVHVNESLELIPIDHGLCLPEALEDPYFEWLHWPQASLPFSEEELDYIRRLDEYRDVDVLRRELPMLREACLRMLILCTTLLKRAAAAGFCLAEIGEMMSRDGIEEASELELLCMQAKLEADNDILAEKLGCDDDDYDDVAISEVSVGEDFHEQFDFEMDHELDHKLSAITGESQLSSSKETDCVSSYPSGFPFLPFPLAPAHNFTFSPRGLHSSRVPLQLWPEVAASEVEDGFSSPCKVSASGPSLWNPTSGALQKLTLDVKTPKYARAERSPRLCSEFCPLIEEEEVLVFADNDMKTSRTLLETDFESPRAMSLRSVSFDSRKQRYSDHGERKTPASEKTGKINVNGGSPPFSLGDMSEEEWMSFLGCFEGLLEEVLANRHVRSASHRQRLGISCQF